MMKKQWILTRMAVLAALASGGSAYAINGAQLGGNGVMNASMGGASIALPLDAGAAANNPAGLAYVPSSMALGLQVFDGQSTADYATNLVPGNHLSNHQTIPALQGGVNWQYSPQLTLGVSLTSSGSGADYGKSALPVPGAGVAKTALQILEAIPTVAWKPQDNLALGFGLNVAYQQFVADGVIVPGPVVLPSHGTQSASGVGWRAGVLWKPGADWSVGVNYKARTSMGGLSGYSADLLAYSGGSIDIPEEYGVGLAWKASPRLTVAADWVRIQWGDVKVMQDPNGFGWSNQPVTRLGLAWAQNERLVLRAGVSHNTNQIGSARTLQNFLVPAVNDTAYTLGLSWTLEGGSELSLGYETDPQTTLNGTGASQGTNLTSTVQMFMLGWQRRF